MGFHFAVHVPLTSFKISRGQISLRPEIGRVGCRELEEFPGKGTSFVDVLTGIVLNLRP